MSGTKLQVPTARPEAFTWICPVGVPALPVMRTVSVRVAPTRTGFALGVSVTVGVRPMFWNSVDDVLPS